jgi:hypothetical protein
VKEAEEPRQRRGAPNEQSGAVKEPDERDRATGAERPYLRIVRGKPTPEELAALTAVIAAVAATSAGPAAARAAGPAAAASGSGTWADRERALRTPLPHGPNAWRTSARPR